MYVLNVDLWSEDALKEVNLVRHTTASPSISSTSPASYAQIEQATPAFSHILPSNVPSSRDAGYPQQITYQPPSQAVTPYGMSQPYGSPFVSTNGGYAQPGYYRSDYPQDVSMHAPMFGPPRVYDSQYGLPPQQRLSIAGTAPAGMFTRNLIGSLAASAFRLQDTEDKIGIWFVLQDLSVRTEGCFRCVIPNTLSCAEQKLITFFVLILVSGSLSSMSVRPWAHKPRVGTGRSTRGGRLSWLLYSVTFSRSTRPRNSLGSARARH